MQRVKDLLAGQAPLRWLFYGDSITHGAAHTYGERDYTQHFTEWLRYERGRPMDVVINTAISGNTTRELLAQFEWRAAQFRPDVALIMIGMNDCEETRALSPAEFGLNLHTLSDKFVSLGAVPVLQTTCPIVWSLGGTRKRLREYMTVIREVAKERALPLVDHFAWWEAAIAEQPLRATAWMNDAIHPGPSGHRAFADLLLRGLGHEPANSRLDRILADRE
jgi:lysophospholipase L1-like esterase